MFSKMMVGLLAVALVASAVAAQADVFNMGGTRNVAGTWTGLASLDFITVGNPGNMADPATGHGSVPYAYQMGKYDVTFGQYCQFLNAVAKSDPYFLYTGAGGFMGGWFSTIAITQSGSSGNYSYAVTGSYSQAANCPIEGIPWDNAARFCNWLQNGQPTGPEGPGTTETGSYNLNGATSRPEIMAVTRSLTATYVLPTEDEWYKCAFYKGGGTNAGYWLYPTRSNTTPINVLSATGTNNANFNDYYYTGTGPLTGNSYTDPTNVLTPVGAFAASPGPYGNFDMCGNVDTWTEEVPYNGIRGYRGGSYAETSNVLSSTGSVKYLMGDYPDLCDPYVGMRIVNIAPTSFSGFGRWISNGNTSWSSSGNWTDGTYAGVPGVSGVAAYDKATFSGSGSATSVDLADVNANLTALSFSGSDYTLSNGTLTLQGSPGAAAVTVSNGSHTINSSVALASNAALTLNTSGRLTFGGNIGETGGSRSLTIGGDSTGLVTLIGTNTYSGGTTLNGGTLAVASDTALGTTGTTGAALQFAGGSLLTTAAITSSRPVSFTSAGGTLNTNGFSSTFNGIVSGSGAWTKTGQGTLTLGGANSFSGQVKVAAGTLAGNVASLTGPVLLSNNASIVFNQAANATYAGTVSGTGSLIKQGTGTLTLGGMESYSGSTIVQSGTLRLPAPVLVPTGAAVLYTFDDRSGSTVINDGSLGSSFSATFSNGATTVAGHNGGNGLYLPVNSGKLLVNNPISLGSGNWTASLWYQGLRNDDNWQTAFYGSASDNYQVMVGGGVSNRTFGGYYSGVNYPVQNGTYALPNDNAWHMVTAVGSNGSTTYYVDGVTVGSVTISSSTNIDSIGSRASAGGGGGMFQFAAAIDDVYISQTALSSSSVQQLFAGTLNALPNIHNALPISTSLAVGANATLDLNGSDQQVGSLANYLGIGGTLTNEGIADATLTISGSSTTSFSGKIQDGATNKTTLAIRGGTLTLAGSNTYTGLTAIDHAKLVVNGSLASLVTVGSGAILGGTGTLGSVTVASGGHLAPGDLLGVLHLTGNLMLAASAVMDYDLDTLSTSDEVSMSSSLLSLSGQQFSDFLFTPLAGFGPGNYTLIDAGLISGSLGTNRSGVVGGRSASLFISGNDLVLTVVPEPSTLALLAAGAMLCLAGYASKKKRAANRRRLFPCVLAAMTLGLLVPQLVQAGTLSWSVSSGDWSTATNWSSGTLPTYSDDTYVANGGTATITLPGQVCSTLSLGLTSGSGAVQLTAGDLRDTAYQYIGYLGTGSLAQSGGTNAIWKDLCIGYGSGSSGTYSLSGTGLLSANSGLYVGCSGTGTFTQTGGTNSNNYFDLGYSVGGSGTYSLSGSGQMTTQQNEIVGLRGTGTFMQSGGTNTMSGGLYLGYYSGSSGTYVLSGSARLSAQGEYVGYASTAFFQQSGGTNSTSSLSIGGSGKYLLASGILQVNGTFVNQGIFSGSGIPAALSSNGILDLSGGTWQNLRAVTLSMGANSLLIVPAGYNILTTFASYGNLGLTYSLGSTLTIPAGRSFSGTISINDPVSCQGAVTATNGSINLNNGLVLSGIGTVNLGSNGSLTVNDLVSQISGGSLSTNNQNVGSGGTGSFTQSGGLSIASYLYLGKNAGDSGTYTLSENSVLCAPILLVGNSGSGTFTQSGGTNSTKFYRPSGMNLYVGFNAGASGTYNLSGNGFLLADSEQIGGNGVGNFFQTGGNNTCLSLTVGNSGAYRLSGSSLLNASGGVGVSGIFTQTGGTNSSGVGSSQGYGVSINTGASYALGGSGLLWTPMLRISSGTLRMSGGTLQLNDPYNHALLTNQGVFDGGGSRGVLTCSPSSILDFSQGSTINTGSMSVNIATGSLVIFPAGFDPATAFGNYTSQGITYIRGNALVVPAGRTCSGQPYYALVDVNDPVSCQGTISIIAWYGNQYAAGISFNNGLTISGTGSANRVLNLKVNDAVSGMTGGSLNVANDYVGYSGTGRFTHTGGTTTLSGGLWLGYNAGDTGSYTLGDTGTLNLIAGSGNGVEYVGYSGTGHFTQTGGINFVSNNSYPSSGGYLFLGNNAGAVGTYTLGGSGLLSVIREYVGYSGSGTFTQSGGTNAIADSLWLGYVSGSSGTYSLNGGTLIVPTMSAGSGTAAFNFNGGTLLASSSFSTSLPMTLGTSGGGATFDTAGYAVTLSGSLSGPGSLTKLGSGTLTLSASNSYLGPTTVAAGKLYFNGSLSPSGLVSVGDGATFGGRGIAGSVTVSGGSAGGTIEAGQGGLGTLTLTGLTFNGNGMIGVANVGATSPTIINVGSLAAAGSAGSVTINVSGSSLLSGAYRLIGYTGTVGGAGGFNAFKLGTTPTLAGPRVGSQPFQLVNNTGEIDLLVSNDYLLWSGAAGSEWSTAAIAAPKNWKLFSNSTATDYLETVAYGNDAVTFDDSVGGGAKSIDIAVASVKPVNVAFNNSAVNYTLQSSGAFGISGTTALTKSGSGTLTVATRNSYSGNTFLKAGTLQIGSTSALGSGTLAWSGGTLSSDGAGTRSIANPIALSGNVGLGDAVNNGPLSLTGSISLTASLRLTVNSEATLSSAVSGTGFGITKAGTGVLTLSANNLFTGGVILETGQLNINNYGALGTSAGTFTIAGTSTIDNATASVITLTTNNPQAWNADFIFLGTQALNLGTGAVTLGGNRQMTVNASTLTVGGAIGGNYSLTKAGTGTLTLSGSNTYSGGIVLAAGRLNIGNAIALGSGRLTIAGSSALDNTAGIAVTLGNNISQAWNADFTFLGTQALNLGVGAVTLGSNRQVTVNTNTLTVGGAIGGNYSLTKAGAGTLTLSGSNTYSGGIVLAAGRLNIGNAVALGSGGLTIAGSSTLDNTAGIAVTLGNNISQAWNADFTFVGSSSLNLGAGPVTLGGNRQVTVSSGALTVGGAIGGNYSLTKAGAGTLTLSGSNTYSGGTLLSAGRLNINNPAALSSGTLTIFGASTLGNTTSAAITLSDNPPQIWNANLTFAGSHDLNLGTGSVTLGGSRQVTVSSNTLTVGGPIGGNYSLTKSGSGTLELRGNNRSGPPITVARSRILRHHAFHTEIPANSFGKGRSRTFC